MQNSEVLKPNQQREEARAFRDESGLPLRSVVIGVTYPFADYRISRGPEADINVVEYVAAGEGVLVIGGEKVHATAGDTYILCAGERHEYYADPVNPWKKFWINFRCDYIAEFFRAYGVRTGVYRADTHALFETALSLSRSGRPFGEICFTVADCIHRVIASAAVAARHGGGKDASGIREALASAVYEKCALDDIADEVHMSKSNMIRVFKRDYGITPYEFLLDQKIEAAKLLLKNSRMTVSDIAARVCVSDEHYFSALFLRKTGMRPGAYRRAEGIF